MTCPEPHKWLRTERTTVKTRWPPKGRPSLKLGFYNYMKEDLRILEIYEIHIPQSTKLHRFRLRNGTFYCFLLKWFSVMGYFWFLFEWDVYQQFYYKDFTSNTQIFLKVKKLSDHPWSNLCTSHEPDFTINGQPWWLTTTWTEGKI